MRSIGTSTLRVGSVVIFLRVPSEMWNDDEFKESLMTATEIQGILGQTDDFFFIKLM